MRLEKPRQPANSKLEIDQFQLHKYRGTLNDSLGLADRSLKWQVVGILFGVGEDRGLETGFANPDIYSDCTPATASGIAQFFEFVEVFGRHLGQEEFGICIPEGNFAFKLVLH